MRRPGRTTIECLLIAVGLVLIVGLDGSIVWALVRVVVVAGVVFAVAVAPRRLPPWATGLIHALFALVTLTVTATIAVSYLSKGGVSVRGVAGVLGATGSIGLLVHGFGAVIHSIHGKRRWTVVPLGLVAAFVVATAVMPAVYATNVPRPQLGGERPSDLGLAFVDATFTTSDGVQLAGWYIPSTNGAAVVLLHGASSTRTSVLGQAAVIAEHGYGVLLFDARGHGDSKGRAMDFGWRGDRDIAAAIDYLQRRSDVDPHRIGAVGMSMGGEEAVGAMASDTRIKATVAEGATSRTSADKSWMADEYGFLGRAQLVIEWMTYRLTDSLTEASTPITLHDAVRAAAPRPVLLIAAGNVRDESLAADHIRSGSPDTVEVWTVDGAAHTGGLSTEPDEWARRVTTFLDAALID